MIRVWHILGYLGNAELGPADKAKEGQSSGVGED